MIKAFVFTLALGATWLPALAWAQDPLDGDWDGALSVPAGIKVPLTLHMTDRGSTLDSPDQNAWGAPVGVTRHGQQVEVDIPGSKARFSGALSADGRTMQGPFVQGGMTMSASFVLRASGAPPPQLDRPQTPKPLFPYLTRDVNFPGGGPGVSLAGTLSLPKGAGPFPALVMIAGSGPQNRDETLDGHKLFLVVADRLTREGIAVLRFDKRGVGASTGSYSRATESDFVADALAAFNWLCAQPEIAKAKVGLIGHSEGAEIAPRVIDQDPRVAFAVLLSTPALPGVETIVEQQSAIALASGVSASQAQIEARLQRRVLDAVHEATDEASAKATAEALLTKAGIPRGRAQTEAREMASPWYREFLDEDPAPALRKLRLPVLVVAGSKDLQILPAANLPIIRAALANDPHAKIVELEGLNHLLQPAKTGTPQEYGIIPTTISPVALDLIAAWLKAQTAN